MNYQTIIEQVKAYVSNLANAPSTVRLPYHNPVHTEAVVSAATRIANHYQLNDQDFFIVLAAAWFHDTGYYTGAPEGHEQRGADLAAAFLGQKDLPAETISAIQRCILATRLPQSPQNLLEEIVCDADLFHLGTEDFAGRNKLMRKEAELLAGKEISGEEWRRGTIRLLETHHYHTDYCRLLLDEGKQANLETQRKKAREDAPKASEEAGVADKKPQKKNRSERGVETVFRITSSNNQRLSSQADSKAHIMIQVNSIIISVLLSVLLRKIDEHGSLAIPCVLLLTVNVVTIIYSVLATRPHIPPGTFRPEDVEAKTVNLLFFGNFYRMSLEDYTAGMVKLMDDADFLYGSLIKDVYFQGIALGRKYRQLRISYNVFMYGLIASVIAFAVAAFFF